MSEFNDWNRKVIDEFRANEGKVGGTLEGATLLLLHSKGTKSKQERINPLGYFRDGERLVVVASRRKDGFAPTNPDWYYNVIAHPELTVEVGTETFRAHATLAKEPERTRLYDKMVEMAPASVRRSLDEYRHNVKRKIPIIVLTPTK